MMKPLLYIRVCLQSSEKFTRFKLSVQKLSTIRCAMSSTGRHLSCRDCRSRCRQLCQIRFWEHVGLGNFCSNLLAMETIGTFSSNKWSITCSPTCQSAAGWGPPHTMSVVEGRGGLTYFNTLVIVGWGAVALVPVQISLTTDASRGQRLELRQPDS